MDQLCWHPINPDILATASLDKTVRFWDARSLKCISVVETSGENIYITWSWDGQTVAVGNKEDIVTFIDYKTFKVKLQKDFKFEVNEMSWNREQDLFFLTSTLGCVYVLSYPSLEQVYVMNASQSTCLSLEFDPTGKYFAIGSADSMVSIWDTQTLICLRTNSRLAWPARALSFSYDGKLLASASEDLLIDICYVETGERVYSIHADSPVFTIAFHPKRYLLAYAFDENDAHQRDVGTVRVVGFKNE